MRKTRTVNNVKISTTYGDIIANSGDILKKGCKLSHRCLQAGNLTLKTGHQGVHFRLSIVATIMRVS